MVNVFGKRPDGFANRAFGNDGIQYGLDGLRAGAITPAQFVDLNTHIGGTRLQRRHHARTRSAPTRSRSSALYRSGAVDSANNLDKVAIIDLRGPDPGAFHDVYRTYAMRARLMRNFGTAANQVLWRGQAPLIGDPSYADDAVLAADTWVARVHGRHARRSRWRRRSVEDKPGTLGRPLHRRRRAAIPSEVCDQTVAAYGTPRLGADEPHDRRRARSASYKPLRTRRLRGHVHRGAVGRAAAGLPDRRLRLLQAGRRPARRDGVAHLPERARAT